MIEPSTRQFAGRRSPVASDPYDAISRSVLGSRRRVQGSVPKRIFSQTVRRRIERWLRPAQKASS